MRNTIKIIKGISKASAAIRLAFYQAGTKPTYNFHCLSPEIERYCRQLGIPATGNRIGGKLVSDTGVIIGLAPKANRLPLIFTPYGSCLPVANFSVPTDRMAKIINKKLSLQAYLRPIKVSSPIILYDYKFFGFDKDHAQAVLETRPEHYPSEIFSRTLNKFESESMHNQAQKFSNSQEITHNFFGGIQSKPPTATLYRPKRQ
jgi:hypothetical protein